MTACSNNDWTKGGKAGRVVTAALVGALSVGAPVVALATTGGVDMLVATASDAFSKGTVEISGTGITGKDGAYSVAATGEDIELTVKVTPIEGSQITVTDNDDYTVEVFAADEDGEPTGPALDAVSAIGEYVVVVTAESGDYAGGSCSATLTVKAANFESVTFSAYEGDDEADTDFTFTGSELTVGVSNDGKLVEGEDYEVKVVKAGTSDLANAAAVDVVGAGNYVAYVTGLGIYDGATKEANFTVDKFDMGDATVTVDDVIGSNVAPTNPTKVVDSEGNELDSSLVKLAFKSGVNGGNLFTTNGEYTFSVSYDDDDNITGSAADVTVYKVGAMATFEYDGKALGDSYVVDLSKDESFSLDDVDVFAGEDELTRSTDYTFTVCDADGKPGKMDDFNKQTPGTYEITVKVKPEQTDYEYGGSKTFTVTIKSGTIDADADVYVTYDGKIVTSVEKAYDGQAIKATDFTVKALDEDDKDVSASITATLYDADGEEVKEAEKAGSYTLKLTSGDYDLTGTTEIPVTISKVDLSSIKVGALAEWYGAEYLPIKADKTSYLWSELDLRYNTGVADSDDSDDASDGEGWDALSGLAGSLQDDSHLKCEKYDEEKGEWVEVSYADRCKTEGDYRITLTGDEDLAENYSFANDDYTTTVEFSVYDRSDVETFTDVTPDDWFFEVVRYANKSEYMNGYSGSKLFGAKDTITRGQVACVLFNMAGNRIDETDLTYEEGKGYVTGFDDVDGTLYYAKAIAWAAQTGVVSGDAGTSSFRPDDEVSRQELAAMLANYARVIDRADVSVEDADAALEGMSDAEGVSAWATESVAWAVENGIMGNGGYVAATDGITRAETAAMVYNYDAME